ncbi:hypothetical protein [Dysosmobacter welbionis]
MNHDEHIASQLRWTAGTIQDSANGGNLTLSDLWAAGKIAGAYQTIYHSAAAGKGGCEAFQAPALGMVDMKTEALLQNGLVSDSMARMLQASLAQRYQNALDVSNRRLAVRQEEALSGETSISQMDRELFHSIYNAVLPSFRRSDGDALAAIQDGMAFGREVTAQNHRENPRVTHWGTS